MIWKEGIKKMKINISISKDGNTFEEFSSINFDELDNMTLEQQKVYIENYCKSAVEKIAEDQQKKEANK
jgi:hypothetical protein